MHEFVLKSGLRIFVFHNLWRVCMLTAPSLLHDPDPYLITERGRLVIGDSIIQPAPGYFPNHNDAKQYHEQRFPQIQTHPNIESGLVEVDEWLAVIAYGMYPPKKGGYTAHYHPGARNVVRVQLNFPS